MNLLFIKIQICARHFCDENSNFLDAIWSDLSVTTSADKPVPVTSERSVNPSYSLLSSMLSSSCLRHEHAPTLTCTVRGENGPTIRLTPSAPPPSSGTSTRPRSHPGRCRYSGRREGGGGGFPNSANIELFCEISPTVFQRFFNRLNKF